MRKLFVLIDDDKVANLINRKMVKRVLPEANIHQTTSAWEALEYLLKLESSKDLQVVILLDINMPGMNGWDFLKELEREFQHLNIVVHILSSSVDPEDKETAARYGLVRSFISKPLSRKKIEENILL